MSGSTAIGTGWSDGESVSVELVSPDGSSSMVGTATAASSGIWQLPISTGSLSNGVYAVVGSGDKGGNGSAALVVGAK